ncbi:MAG: hypothetical protein DMG42_17190 [Acidobacteria bacterium]|nr:MAG: hypothetical protein DMG42_17190 [Acidobacteriota bacterium]
MDVMDRDAGINDSQLYDSAARAKALFSFRLTRNTRGFALSHQDPRGSASIRGRACAIGR